jgi:hypothetical protein
MTSFGHLTVYIQIPVPLPLSMKKWLVRYLLLNLLAFTLPENITYSVLELGNLVAHFNAHGQDDHEENIFSFLMAHYFNKEHHEAHHDCHADLPFHNHHDGSLNNIAQSPSLLPQSVFHVSHDKPVLATTILVVKSQQWISSSYIGDIWQPPKA